MADDDGKFESMHAHLGGGPRGPRNRLRVGRSGHRAGDRTGKTAQERSRSRCSALLLRADARLDVMHFEMMSDGDDLDEDEMDEMFDPSCLLMVVESLVELTRGVAIDPASGAILP